MALGKFSKSPDEVKRYSVDYVNWLDTGEYLSATTVTPTPTTNITVDVDAVGSNDTTLSFVVAGGNASTSYKLKARATTTTGQVKEDIIFIEVKSL